MTQVQERVESSPLDVFEELSYADRMIMPWGRHFESTRQFLALGNVALIFDTAENGGEVSIPGRKGTIPFDTMRDHVIPGEISENNQRIIGFGCHHQYVESGPEVAANTKYAPLFAVPGARFVIAARVEEKDEILQQIADGIPTNNDTEYYQTTQGIILERPELCALVPHHVRKGTSEWRGRWGQKTRTITALTETKRTLNHLRLDILHDDLGGVSVNAWWRDFTIPTNE